MASIPETATSLVLHEFNQPPTLEQSPTENPGPGTALVRVLAAPLRPHLKQAFEGQPSLNISTPYYPGNSAVARIIAVGPDAVALEPGQLVFVSGLLTARDDAGSRALVGLHEGAGDREKKLYDSWKGLYRDIASVPIENCIPLNEDVLIHEKGYSHADLAYFDRLAVAYGGFCAAQLHPGDTVIVNPATGNYSGAVIELAAQLGCRVIALTRTASKLAALAELYPHRITVVQVTTDAAADEAAIRRATAACGANTSGADALIDISPYPATFAPGAIVAALSALRPHAHAALLGAVAELPMPYMKFMFRNISVHFQFMYTREQAQRLAHMLELGVVRLGTAAGHNNVSYKLVDHAKAFEESERAEGWGQQFVFTP